MSYMSTTYHIQYTTLNLAAHSATPTARLPIQSNQLSIWQKYSSLFTFLNLRWALQQQNWTHIAVLVVEVDDQAEGASSHGLGGDEGVLEGGLALRGNHEAQLQGREVLDVELEVLRVAEGGVQGLHHKVLRALVGEAHQELHNVVGWEVWGWEGGN